MQQWLGSHFNEFLHKDAALTKMWPAAQSLVGITAAAAASHY
jgi:hypothetical protein